MYVIETGHAVVGTAPAGVLGLYRCYNAVKQAPVLCVKRQQ
jgi:hypothetical protein